MSNARTVMANDMSVQQNSSEFMDRICASRQAYGIVKRVASLQSWLAVSSAIIGPVVGYAYPDFKGWAAFYAIAVLIVDIVFLEPAHTYFQTLGAKIQESFDTELFQLPWNSHRCDPRPDPEIVNRLAAKFKNKHDTEQVKDWYPSAVGNVSIEYGRLICQRTNMTWDSALRRYYGMFFVVLIVAMLLGVGALALYLNWDASQIAISLLLPLLPAGLKLFRELKKHWDSANASDRTKSILKGIWDRALTQTVSASDFVHESRRIQDEIYDRRKTSPPIPDWLYSWLREQYQDDMRFGADQMVKEAKGKTGPET